MQQAQLLRCSGARMLGCGGARGLLAGRWSACSGGSRTRRWPPAHRETGSDHVHSGRWHSQQADLPLTNAQHACAQLLEKQRCQHVAARGQVARWRADMSERCARMNSPRDDWSCALVVYAEYPGVAACVIARVHAC
eukprot:6210715-Pleurochrysis_carterae.AAC.2